MITDGSFRTRVFGREVRVNFDYGEVSASVASERKCSFCDDLGLQSWDYVVREIYDDSGVDIDPQSKIAELAIEKLRARRHRNVRLHGFTICSYKDRRHLPPLRW